MTVWCSNDYLGMGQHPDVVQAMVEAVQACGTGAGARATSAATNHTTCCWRRELADLHGKEARASFHLGLCVELGRALHPWQRASRMR